MNQFILEKDESLEKQCGTIFLTTKGRISFHCTLCEEVYCGFESYQSHLNGIHLSANLKFEIDELDMAIETTNIDTNFQIDVNNVEPKHEDLSTTIEIDTKLDSEALKNETNNVSYLNPIAIPQKVAQTFNNFNASKAILQQTICENLDIEINTNMIKKVAIPKAVREVVKRTVYIAKTTPDEERKHKCPICGFGFKEKGNMKHHLQRHSNERNYACTDCDKRFYNSTELNTHRKTHTQERLILCTECGETFATKSRLGDHLKRHRGQKDYHCQYPGCQKAFYSSQYLKNHMLSHSTERHLICSVCDATFKQKIALKNHMKLHANKREFKCKICAAEFNQTAGLYSHMKSVHKSI